VKAQLKDAAVVLSTQREAVLRASEGWDVVTAQRSLKRSRKSASLGPKAKRVKCQWALFTFGLLASHVSPQSHHSGTSV
jgi:hypothetical protein